MFALSNADYHQLLEYSKALCRKFPFIDPLDAVHNALLEKGEKTTVADIKRQVWKERDHHFKIYRLQEEEISQKRRGIVLHKCARCKEYFPETCFYRNGRGLLTSYCSECRKLNWKHYYAKHKNTKRYKDKRKQQRQEKKRKNPHYYRDRRLNNLENERKYDATYRKNNRDLINERQRKRAQQDLATYNKKKREYYDRNKEKINKRKRQLRMIKSKAKM